MRQAQLRVSRIIIAVWVAVTAPVPLWASISGYVRESGSNAPVAGARVHLQAETSPVATTGADGSYTLEVNPSGTVVVTAAVPYDRNAPVNYTMKGVQAGEGAINADILLDVVPVAENTTYVPIKAATPNGCGDCHSEHLAMWSSSNHAGAATDTWVLDLYSGTGTPGGAAGYVYRASHDPGETGFCATCHAPVAEAHAPGTVYLDEVTDASAREGVNCSACHTIDSVSDDVEKIHLLGNATNRFPLAGANGSRTHDYVWGPLDDVTYLLMKSSYAPVFGDSLLCASCHEYSNPDTGAPGAQTYAEWLASPYAVAGQAYRTCQDCHMPSQTASGKICDPPGGSSGIPTRPGTQRRAHDFAGATPSKLSAAIWLTVSAQAAGGVLDITAKASNQGAGHNFPTGVSIRNALLVASATYESTPLTLLVGPTVPDWADDDVEGKQDGDYAGQPGKGFAKILQGRINGQGAVTSPVLFIDAESVLSDTEIPAGATDTTALQFGVPPQVTAGQAVHVTVKLLYRRAFRALAVTKGWTTTPQGGPIEIEVARSEFDVVVDGGATPSPTATSPVTATPTATPELPSTPTPPPTVATPSTTPVPSASLTPAETAVPTCIGDCGEDGQVTVDEVLTMVNIALGNAPVSDCPHGDSGGDGQITVDEILTAVNNALNGCG